MRAIQRSSRGPDTIEEWPKRHDVILGGGGVVASSLAMALGERGLHAASRRSKGCTSEAPARV
jgi:hypothetical protein